MEKKNVVFTKDGAKVAVKEVRAEDYADRTLKSAVNWGRYGELFAYDEAAEMLSLENPQ